MTNGNFTDEQLMAFADGEADETRASAIREAMATDPLLTRRIDMFRESSRLAGMALPLEPVSSDLEARIRAMAAKAKGAAAPAELGAAQRVRVTANDNAPWWRLPLAASIVFALGLGGGYMLRGETLSEQSTVSIAGLMDRELQSALETVPSGNETAVSGGKFRAIASFKNRDSNVCREFEKDSGSPLSVVGVACHENGRWSVNTVVASGQNAQGYAPASSLEAIDAYVEAIGAQAMMTPDEEREALRAFIKP